MRYRYRWLVYGLVLFMLVPQVHGEAQGLDAPTYQLWQRHWRVFAQRCAEFEGEYLCCPKYDKRYPSSAGISLRQAEVKLSEKVEIHNAGMVYTKTIKMPIEEAMAMALPIPKLAVGEYGYLESAEVAEVLGPESMLITDTSLIDLEKTGTQYKADRAKAREAEDSREATSILEHMYSRREALAERQKHKSFKKGTIRLEGFPTRGLTENQRWKGPRDEGLHILIVRQEVGGNERRPEIRLVAVDIDKVKWGLDEDGFIALLAARGLDPAGFVERVMKHMAEADPETAQLEVFDYLLPPVPDPEAAKKDAEAGEESGDSAP